MSWLPSRTVFIAGAVVVTFAMVSNLIAFGAMEGFEVFDFEHHHRR